MPTRLTCAGISNVLSMRLTPDCTVRIEVQAFVLSRQRPPVLGKPWQVIAHKVQRKIAESRNMNLKNILGKFGIATAAVVVVLTVTPSATATPAHSGTVTVASPDWDLGTDHCDDIKIQARGNGLFVAAEAEYTGSVFGMLRARSSSVGPWEKFSLCPMDGYYTLFSYGTGSYVSAEKNYTGADAGMLRARSASVKSFEKFEVRCPSYCTIKSLVNGQYVSAELAYTGTGYGMLRARSTAVGDWEKFSFSQG